MRGACQPLSPGLSLVGKAISEPGLQTRNQVQRGEQGGRSERAGWADPRGPAAWPHRCDLEEAQPLKARALSKPRCREKQATGKRAARCASRVHPSLRAKPPPGVGPEAESRGIFLLLPESLHEGRG